MKRLRTIFCLLTLCLLVFVTGCQSLVEMAAAEMNLTTADLDANWSLEADLGHEDLVSFVEDPQGIVDANFRGFSAEEKAIFSMVATMDSWSGAQAEVMGGDALAFTNAFAEILVGETGTASTRPFPVQNPSNLGEEVTMAGLEFTDEDLIAYEIHFSTSNVVVFIAATGPTDVVTREFVADLAQSVKDKVP